MAFLLSATTTWAAFPVKTLVTDTAIAITPEIHTTAATPAGVKKNFHLPFRDRQDADDTRLGRISCWLSYIALFGIGALGLAIYIGLFAGVAAIIVNSLIVALLVCGLAGFIIGIIALGQHPNDDSYAERGLLVGSLVLMVPFLPTFLYVCFRKKNRRG